MKNPFNRFGVFVALGVVILALGLFIILMPNPQPTKPQPPAIEQQLNSHLWDLQIDAKAKGGKIAYLESVIEQKNKQLEVLAKDWRRKGAAIKELTTDGQIAYVQGYLEVPDKIRKVLIGKDTAVIFTPALLSDVAYLCNDFDYQGITIDSLLSMIGSYDEQVQEYRALVDNLTRQTSTYNDKLAVKDDRITALERQIEDERKAAKKSKRMAFFNGLGIGGVAGFIGGIIVIL